MRKGFCEEVKIEEDGSVYFTLEEMGEKTRFMECVVEFDNGEFVLFANDSEVVRF